MVILQAGKGVQAFRTFRFSTQRGEPRQLRCGQSRSFNRHRRHRLCFNLVPLSVTMAASEHGSPAGDMTATWADFEAGSTFSGDGSENVSTTKKSKKKSKKGDRSESTGKKKKSKKSKKRDAGDEDEDIESLASNALFAKAIAKAKIEDEFAEAFRDMQEDQEFVNAFGAVGQSDQDPFVADFNTGIGMQEQAPDRKRSSKEDTGGENGGWIVDNNSKGAQMQDYGRRRLSVTHSVLSSRSAGSNIEDQAAGSIKSKSTSKTPSAAGLSEDTPQLRNHDPTVERATSVISKSSMFDVSHCEFDKVRDFSDSATIHSELTGLTGVFSSMPSNFEEDDDDDDDDDEDSADDELAILAYPKYDPAESKFMMMQNQPKTKREKHRVKFGTVTVRDFQRILGDNPSCKAGAPLSIGWKVESVVLHPTPEAHDLARGRPIRNSANLILTRDERHNILLKLGYSDREIAQAVRAVIKDKNRRRTTVNNLSASKVEEKLESVSTGLKRMLFLK